MIAYRPDMPTVSTPVMENIVKRVVAVTSPRKVVLFGSRARGTNRPDSDIDLLVIAESTLPRDRRAAAVYAALADVGPGLDVDVMVYTPAEAEEWRDVPAAFVTTALREGKVLYEQEHG